MPLLATSVAVCRLFWCGYRVRRYDVRSSQDGCTGTDGCAASSPCPRPFRFRTVSSPDLLEPRAAISLLGHYRAFHGGGNTDIALSDYLTGEVSILLGNGDGTFQKALKFEAASPVRLEAGDFNEDGNQDLAVVESNGTANGAIAIFIGDGHGHFRLSDKHTVGVGPISVALADFDGDGHLDVAVTNKGFDNPGSIMTFLGDGKGRLHGRKTYTLDGGPWGIAAADLNGDGRPDIAVTLDPGGTVAVYMNNGRGTFLAPVIYDAGGGEVLDVKTGDLKNNGSQDLVVVNSSLGRIAILMNRGNGTFKNANFYSSSLGKNGSGADAVVVADFHLNGRLDLAVANQDGDSAVLYGNGLGGFGNPVSIRVTKNTSDVYSIAVGDFNNDGAPDIAIPIEADPGTVAVFINTQ